MEKCTVEALIAYANGRPIEYFDEISNSWVPVKDLNIIMLLRPKLVKPSIDWKEVALAYNWMATDRNGRTYLYMDKPTRNSTNWVGDYATMVNAAGFRSFKDRSAETDWRDSLVGRNEQGDIDSPSVRPVSTECVIWVIRHRPVVD